MTRVARRSSPPRALNSGANSGRMQVSRRSVTPTATPIITPDRPSRSGPCCGCSAPCGASSRPFEHRAERAGGLARLDQGDIGPVEELGVPGQRGRRSSSPFSTAVLNRRALCERRSAFGSRIPPSAAETA